MLQTHNASSQFGQTQSIITPQDSQYTFCFQICPSHLTISHNFGQSIKPKSFYQLFLIKDSHQSSQINQYQNFPISAKVYQNKIVISNVRLSFTVDCDQRFRSEHSYYLRLVQLKAYHYEQDTVIGEYQLDIDSYIRHFKNRQSNYFYQQCVIHPQVYLTYEIFIENTRLRLNYLITEMKKRQKQQMKEHIMKSLEEKKQYLLKLQPNSEDQQQLKEVLKAHLTVLHHLDSDQKDLNDVQSQRNFQQTKIMLKENDLPIQSPQFSLKNTVKDTLQILSEERDHFSIKSSRIDLRQEIEMPEFKGCQVRKSASLTGQMRGNVSKENSSGILKNDSSYLLKNESSLILIDVKLPRIKEHQQAHDSALNFREQLSSQLSVNNEFQQALRRIVQNERKLRSKNIMTSVLLEQFGSTESDVTKGDKITSNKHGNRSYLSQISLGSSIYAQEVKRTKFLVFIVCIVAVFLFVYLVDHPYFDFLEGRGDTIVDGDYLDKRNKRLKQKFGKNAHKKESKHKKHSRDKR